MSDRETQLSEEIIFPPHPEKGLDLSSMHSWLSYFQVWLTPCVSFYQEVSVCNPTMLIMEVIFYEWQYEIGGFFPASLVKSVSFWLNGERALSVGFLLKGDRPSEYDNISV